MWEMYTYQVNKKIWLGLQINSFRLLVNLKVIPQIN